MKYDHIEEIRQSLPFYGELPEFAQALVENIFLAGALTFSSHALQAEKRDVAMAAVELLTAHIDSMERCKDVKETVEELMEKAGTPGSN